MNRRMFVTGLAASTALAACQVVSSGFKLLRNLVFAFVHVTGLLPSIPHLGTAAINHIKDLLAQAQYIVDTITETITDQSKDAAQKVLQLILAVMDILAPVAQDTQPFNSIIAAAKVMVPIIAGMFGIAVGVPRRLVAEETMYPTPSQSEAEATLARYAQ